MFSFVMRKGDFHCRNTNLSYSARETHATRITGLEKDFENIKSSFRKRMQVLQKEVKTEDRILNEIADKRDLVMEHFKSKEVIYATINDEFIASKQQLNYIEKEREKALGDLYHFSSNQQMKTGDILAALVTSGLIRLTKKTSAWKRVKLFFRSKLRRREARKEALSNHVEHASYYLTEVATTLETLFPKYSDITESHLPVGNNDEKKNDVNIVTSEDYTFFDDALLISSAYEQLTQLKHDADKCLIDDTFRNNGDLSLNAGKNMLGQFS